MQQILLHKTKRGKTMNFIKTKYGKIATSNNRYLTNRNKEHYFVVYGGFGISSTEIEIMIQNQVKEILIYYHHSNKDLTIYKTTLINLILHGRYHNNKGDEQKVLNIEELETVGTEKCKKN
jgi:hypothetical protein